MWSESYVLFISCIFTRITFSHQQSIGCPKNCSLKVINEELPHSITTINNQECKDMTFPQTSYIHMSKVNVESFPFRDQYRNYSQINMTFLKLKWHYLKIRFKSRETRETPFCQELKLDDGVKFSEEAQVQLHCHRFCEDNQVLDIEYVTSTHNKVENKIFSMKIPNWNHIKNDSTCKTWELFMYIDTTYIPKLIVHWQNAPAQLGIKSYILNMTDAETEEVVRTMQVLTDHLLTAMAEEFNGLYSGKFYFTLQPECGNRTKGFISKSAEVRIDLTSNTYFLLIAGGMVTVISLLLFILALKILTTPDEPPTVLIVYQNTRSVHVEAMVAFALFLCEVCHLKAKIDEVDIRLCDNTDPFSWYQEMFSQADAVVVVSSPPRSSSDDVGTFYNLGEVALNLLKEQFCEKKQKFVCVLLPYCNEEDIPQEAKCLRRFTLLRDLDDMLVYLHGRHKFPLPSCLYFVRRLLTPNSKSDLCSDVQILSDIFEKAAKELQKPSSPNTDTCFENMLGRIPEVVSHPIPSEVNRTSYSDSSDDGAYPGQIDDFLGHAKLQNEE